MVLQKVPCLGDHFTSSDVILTCSFEKLGDSYDGLLLKLGDLRLKRLVK